MRPHGSSGRPGYLLQLKQCPTGNPNMKKIVVTVSMIAGLLLNIAACMHPADDHRSGQAKAMAPSDLSGGGGGGGGGY